MAVAALKAPIDQIGILTDDLDRSVNDWINRFGVGPWMVFKNVLMEGTYRGKPTSVIIGAVANRWLRGLYHTMKELPMAA